MQFPALPLLSFASIWVPVFIMICFAFSIRLGPARLTCCNRSADSWWRCFCLLLVWAPRSIESAVYLPGVLLSVFAPSLFIDNLPVMTRTHLMIWHVLMRCRPKCLILAFLQLYRYGSTSLDRELWYLGPEHKATLVLHTSNFRYCSRSKWLVSFILTGTVFIETGNEVTKTHLLVWRAISCGYCYC